jgi:hypothetical protein
VPTSTVELADVAVSVDNDVDDEKVAELELLVALSRLEEIAAELELEIRLELLKLLEGEGEIVEVVISVSTIVAIGLRSLWQ